MKFLNVILTSSISIATYARLFELGYRGKAWLGAMLVALLIQWGYETISK